jgi:Sel1 repeat
LWADYAQAVAWYRKAAEQGYANARHALGLMLENGWGLPKDQQQVIEWFVTLRSKAGKARRMPSNGSMSINRILWG